MKTIDNDILVQLLTVTSTVRSIELPRPIVVPDVDVISISEAVNPEAVYGILGVSVMAGTLCACYRDAWSCDKVADASSVKSAIGGILWYADLLEECNVHIGSLRVDITKLCSTIGDDTPESCMLMYGGFGGQFTNPRHQQELPL